MFQYFVMAILAGMAVLNQISRLNDLENRIERNEKKEKHPFSWKIDNNNNNKDCSRSEEVERIMDDIRHLMVRLQKIEDKLQKL